MSKVIVKDNKRGVVIPLGDQFFAENKDAQYKNLKGEYLPVYSEPTEEELAKYWEMNGDGEQKLESSILSKKAEIKTIPKKVQELKDSKKDWIKILKDKKSSPEEISVAEGKVKHIDNEIEKVTNSQIEIETAIEIDEESLAKIKEEKESVKKK